jgi:hypothetical protein
MRNESLEKYVSDLKREDNSIWKPIKNRRNPKRTSPQSANTSIQHPQDHGKKVTRKKLKYLQNIFPKFSLHITIIKTRKWNKTQLHPFKSKKVLKHLL